MSSFCSKLVLPPYALITSTWAPCGRDGQFMPLPFKETSQRYHMTFPLTSHWPEPSHMTAHSCERGQEVSLYPQDHVSSRALRKGRRVATGVSEQFRPQKGLGGPLGSLLLQASVSLATPGGVQERLVTTRRSHSQSLGTRLPPRASPLLLELVSEQIPAVIPRSLQASGPAWPPRPPSSRGRAWAGLSRG